MPDGANDRDARDGALVPAEKIPAAVTAGLLTYEDGSTQTFDANGSTNYLEHGRATAGEWYLDDEGRFCSFWPPSYRACYDLSWVVEEGAVVGLRFADTSGRSTSVGRYS